MACSAGPRKPIRKTSFIAQLSSGRHRQSTAPARGWNDSFRQDPANGIRYRRAMARRPAVHEVAVVATHGVVPFDLATPIEIFRGSRLADGRRPYRLQVCGVA